MDELFVTAAAKIKEADILLLSIGAGFSADSGLAVYKDIADVPAYNKAGLSYVDLCSPDWLSSNPSIFFGFWGKCFNDYRQTKPHDGYQIIKKWRDQYFKSSDKDSFQYQFQEKFNKKWNSFLELRDGNNEHLKNPNIGPFFIYSSNVDGHPITAGFEEAELCEIHGTIETWQCMDSCSSTSDYDKVAAGVLWKAPKEMEFFINPEDLTAPESFDSDQSFVWENHPKCPKCGDYARPNILMFGDFSWDDDGTGDDRYDEWENCATRFIRIQNKKMVILEIGCGLNVPTVRFHNEALLASLGDNCTLIRINPEDTEEKTGGRWRATETDTDVDNTIVIPSKGLKALRKIDKILSQSV